MKSKTTIILILCLSILLVNSIIHTAELTQQQKDWLKKADRYEKDGWIFLHIEGEPYERGFQHGYLIADEFKEAIRVNNFLAEWYTGETFDFFVQHGYEMFASKIDEEYVQEMKGIAAGITQAGYEISYEEILAWNGLTELLDYWWPTVVGEMPLKNDKCSAFIATGDYTEDGEIVLAHNTWNLYAAGQFVNVIIDIQPDSGHRLLMQSAPGLIDSGTDYFITDAGIIGTETTIGGYSGFNPEKTPEFVRERKAMQYAESIDEWIQIMQKDNNGAYANSWLLGDIETNEIARFEQGLKYDSIEKTTNGFYSGYNVANDLKIRNQECTNACYSDIRTPMGARRVRWNKLLNEYKGQIENELAKEFLADHYDEYLQEENMCSRNICGHYDLDPMQYWPERLPYAPQGCVDGKVVDSKMAERMQMWARWGCSCGAPFNAGEFLKQHPQYDWLEGYLSDRPSQEWTIFVIEK
ncbi:MAG: hypothetical protein JW794_04485 [Candidatus Cloacimonetes bacterium]|nr:hypothetical protein [Candidatus Cloacimonadota bacterium]